MDEESVNTGTCLAGDASRAGLLLLKNDEPGKVRTGKSRVRSKIDPGLKKSLVLCDGISMRGISIRGISGIELDEEFLLGWVSGTLFTNGSDRPSTKIGICRTVG